jgi:hypothetical protein
MCEENLDGCDRRAVLQEQDVGSEIVVFALNVHFVDVRHWVLDALAAPMRDADASALSYEDGARTVPDEPLAHDVGDQQLRKAVRDCFRTARACWVGVMSEVRSALFASAKPDSGLASRARVDDPARCISRAQQLVLRIERVRNAKPATADRSNVLHHARRLT